MECTNLDIKDAAYLHVVHTFQYPTAHSTAKPIQNPLANSQKENYLHIPVVIFGKYTMPSRPWYLQANLRQGGMEADSFGGLWALRSILSNKKLVGEQTQESQISSNEEKEKLIKDNMDGESAGARMSLDDAETLIKEEHQDVKNAANVA